MLNGSGESTTFIQRLHCSYMKPLYIISMLVNCFTQHHRSVVCHYVGKPCHKTSELPIIISLVVGRVDQPSSVCTFHRMIN